jgi:hypothetical protein
VCMEKVYGGARCSPTTRSIVRIHRTFAIVLVGSFDMGSEVRWSCAGCLL